MIDDATYKELQEAFETLKSESQWKIDYLQQGLDDAKIDNANYVREAQAREAELQAEVKAAQEKCDTLENAMVVLRGQNGVLTTLWESTRQALHNIEKDFMAVLG